MRSWNFIVFLSSFRNRPFTRFWEWSKGLKDVGVFLMVQKYSYPRGGVYRDSGATTLKLWYLVHGKTGGPQLRYEIDDFLESKAEVLSPKADNSSAIDK